MRRPACLRLFKRGCATRTLSFRSRIVSARRFEAGTFDTAFLSLVLQFADHARTIAEMHRVVKPGGLLIIANLDVHALSLPQRMQCLFRVVYQGRRGYAVRPPRRFGRNVIGKAELCKLLQRSGFEVIRSETMTNNSRASYIPVDYICARKIGMA